MLMLTSSTALGAETTMHGVKIIDACIKRVN